MSEKQSIELSRAPSPKDELETFKTPDERADERDKNHQLDILKAEQGPIGRLIGSSDSSLNVALILLIIGGLLMIGCLVGEAFGLEEFNGYFEKLVTFELTIAGYVMGKKTS